jgi:hypothetical protein
MAVVMEQDFVEHLQILLNFAIRKYFSTRIEFFKICLHSNVKVFEFFFYKQDGVYGGDSGYGSGGGYSSVGSGYGGPSCGGSGYGSGGFGGYESSSYGGGIFIIHFEILKLNLKYFALKL